MSTKNQVTFKIDQLSNMQDEKDKREEDRILKENKKRKEEDYKSNLNCIKKLDDLTLEVRQEKLSDYISSCHESSQLLKKITEILESRSTKRISFEFDRPYRFSIEESQNGCHFKMEQHCMKTVQFFQVLRIINLKIGYLVAKPVTNTNFIVERREEPNRLFYSGKKLAFIKKFEIIVDAYNNEVFKEGDPLSLMVTLVMEPVSVVIENKEEEKQNENIKEEKKEQE